MTSHPFPASVSKPRTYTGRAEMKTTTVRQSRRLRDGRQLVEVTCPHCDSTHWLVADTTLAYCLTHANMPMFIEGLGEPVR